MIEKMNDILDSFKKTERIIILLIIGCVLVTILPIFIYTPLCIYFYIVRRKHLKIKE